MFSAQVCTWAKTSGTDLVEIGATIPLAAIENAPADAPMQWPPARVATIDLPAAVRERAGLTQLAINWEPSGHPPVAFLTPHFDFHFYALPEPTVARIDCKDERKPAVIPAGYDLPDFALPPDMAAMVGVPTLVGVCVPKMGMHAMPAADVSRPDAFDGTIIVGYYEAKPIFIEPMISRALLLKRQSFDLATPVVPGFAGEPSRFRADYDPARQEYRFAFSGFSAAR